MKIQPALQSAIGVQAETTVQATVLTGAAAWIDTDVGALGVADGIWVVVMYAGAGQAGARESGSVANPLMPASWWGTTLVRVVAGHLDLRRTAADAYYQFVASVG